MVRAGRRREPGLRLPADGGDHLRARPTGELERRIAHGAGSTRDQHRPAAQRARLQPRRAVLGNRQGPVRRHGRDTDAGSEIEVRARREREDAFGGDDGELLRGAARWAAVAGKGDPDAIAHFEAGDTGADRVDDAGAVVVGNRRLGQLPAEGAAARLPVGRIHARHEHANPHLAVSRFGNRLLHELEHGRITQARVRDRSHARTLPPAYQPMTISAYGSEASSQVKRPTSTRSSLLTRAENTSSASVRWCGG